MTVSVGLTSNIDALDDLDVYLADIEDNAFEVAEDVYRRIEPDFLDELQYYPPVPPNSRYIRTGRLKRGFTVIIERRGGGFRLYVRNPVDYTQWVVGSFAQNRGAAARFQRPYHRDNGWQLATDTATFWFGVFQEQFEEQFARELGEFARTSFRRRASTRIR